MAIQAEYYEFKECDVSLSRGGTKHLAAGVYPVIVTPMLVTIDIIKQTEIAPAEFFRLQAQGLATKRP